MARVLVLGVGNSLLTDDGAGVHAAAQLSERAGEMPTVTILDGGTIGFSLLPALADAEALIAFDAARAGGNPGDVFVREGEAFDHFVRRASRSVHEVGLSDLLDMARLCGQLPERRVLIGIEPATIDWGLMPSAAVAVALPRCIDLALRLIERWNARPPGLAITVGRDIYAN